MHNRFIRLVLKVAIPAALEVWRGPTLHLSKLSFGWSDLHTSVDSIGCEWASALNIPFIEDLLLDFWHATDEVVEAFSTYPSSSVCDYRARTESWTYQA